MKMKIALSVVATAVAALFTQVAVAQDAASAPKSRAEVKAEAKANKTPAGEAGVAPAKEPKSTKSKAERKAETAEARKARELAPAGDVGGEKSAAGPKASKADIQKARAERKAATAEARKDVARDIRSMAASLLRQDETKGIRGLILKVLGR